MSFSKCLVGVFVFFVCVVNAQNILTIRESDLKKYLGEKNLQAFNSLVSKQQALVSRKEFKDQFSASAFANVTYINTNEEPFIAFQPIISPQNIIEVGVRKRIPYGIDTSASIGFDNRQFDLGQGTQNPSIATSSLNINMNLWKNFLGKLDQAQLSTLILQEKKREIEDKINQSQQHYTLRSMFWNLVTVEQQVKISQSMADLAKRQLVNSQRMYRQSATDLANVSFYKSQLASRNNAVIVYNYNKQLIVDQFKRMVPEFSQYSDIQVTSADVDKTRDNVLDCVSSIQQSASVPEDKTFYSELIQIITDTYSTQNTITKTYDDIDINLNANVFTRAVDPMAFDAFEESFTENRRGLSATLSLNIPLGNTKTEADKLKLNKMLLDSEIRTLKQSFLTQYQSVKRSSSLLLESIKQQKNNLASLKTRSREILRKFNQGRLSISDYISDQDRLLQTELQLMDSQNLIIQTLLDYLNVFSQSQCAFNQVSL